SPTPTSASASPSRPPPPGPASGSSGCWRTSRTWRWGSAGSRVRLRAGGGPVLAPAGAAECSPRRQPMVTTRLAASPGPRGWPALTAPLLALLLFAASVVAGGCQSGPVPAAEFVTQADRLHRDALAGTVNPNRELAAYFDEISQRLVGGAQEASGGKFKDPVF